MARKRTVTYECEQCGSDIVVEKIRRSFLFLFEDDLMM
jgi:hypothetical protein